MSEKKVLQRIKTAVKNLFISLKEQRVIFIFSILSFIFCCLHIYDYEEAIFTARTFYDTFWKISLALLMSCLFALPASFLTRSMKAIKKYLIQTAVAIAGGVTGYFAQQGFGNSIYGDLYFWGIFFALILVTIFIFLPKENQKTYIAGLVKHFFFSLLLSTILFAAASLLIVAFQNLIYEFDDYGEIYEACAAFCYFVFALNIFVYYLFYKREEESSGKAFKIIILYILLPVFFILIGLLYAYLIKALILLKFPKGQMNWIVSFASCFYFVFYFILKEYEDLPAIKVFYKFGAFAFIPLVCVQIPAYIIRLNAYGFTGWRFSSLMFIIFTVLMFTLTFIKKGKYIKYSILILAVIILIASVTPLNLIDVAHKSQTKRMMDILNKYELFDNQNNRLFDYDTDIINEQMSKEDKEQLSSSYNYLRYPCEIPLPDWTRTVDGDYKSFYELFKIIVDENEDNVIYKGWYPDQKDSFGNYKPVDISEFSKAQKFYVSESSWGEENGNYNYYVIKLNKALIEIDGKSYDMTDFLFNYETEDLHEQYLRCELDDNIVVYITDFYYYWNTALELFSSYNISGYIFWKN